MRIRRPAVFLDRDGVLNEVAVENDTPRSPRSAEELHVVANAAEELSRLRHAGYLLVVVSNQPDIARGLVTASAVQGMHAKLEAALPVDAVYFCPHDTTDRCNCRKPEPGMLLTAERDHSLALDASWLIGDRWVDIAAAHSAKVRSVLIDRPWSWEPTSSGAPPPGLEPDERVADLSAAVAVILADAQKS